MIETKNLSFSYTTEDGDGEEITKDVLLGIDLQIKKGSFVSILGANGSGKSTLLKHFNALLLPSGGKVYVKGLDTDNKKNVFKIRQDAGMVFQNPDNQIVAAIVCDEVAFACENLGVERNEMQKRVDAALSDVGMSDYKNEITANLSGGQKQRLSIASVLTMESECILLDEPTSMLDPVGRDAVIKTLKRLNKEKGITVILITHSMDEAAQGDRVIVLDKGKIELDGTPKEVFMEVDTLNDAGLSLPQITSLAVDLKNEGFSIPDGILTDDELIFHIEKLMGAKI